MEGRRIILGGNLGRHVNGIQHVPDCRPPVRRRGFSNLSALSLLT